MLLLLAATQAAPPARPVPAAANTLARTPDAFYGQVVSVTAPVDRMLSPTAFVLAHDVLVIVPTLIGPVEARSHVTVVGEAMAFDAAAIAARVKDYTLDLGAEAAAARQGRPVIVATSVVNAAMVDLGTRPPPPMTPEEEAFDKVMKRVGPAFNDLRTAAGASDAGAIAEQAKALKAAFADAEVFWKARRTADALTWTRGARTQLTAIERAAAAGSWDQVKTSAGELNRTCQTCHTAYRERLEDGTYRVKSAASR